jgi:hypothetical protein
MPISRRWAGRVFGTNTGNLYLTLEGEDAKLQGKLRVADDRYGVAIYSVRGAFDGQQLTLTGKADTPPQDGVSHGDIEATAKLNAKGELRGDWESSLGTAGTFTLHPHDQPEIVATAATARAEQIHSARHDFGAVSLSVPQFTALADDVQQTFQRPVIVTILTDTETTRFLNDFKQQTFAMDRARLIKLYVQEPDPSGVNKTVTIEFGPQFNYALVQGPDDGWVLGQLEKIKRWVRPSERTYPGTYKKYGVGFNQLLLGFGIIYLPSLPDLLSRAVLMVGVVLLAYGVTTIHARLIPYTAIYTKETPKGLLARSGPQAISLLASIAASVAATILAGLLQGWLHLPGKS